METVYVYSNDGFTLFKDEVYSVCLKTCDDRMDGSEFLGSMPHLAGDWSVIFIHVYLLK